jgi:uncharacterized membrane protein
MNRTQSLLAQAAVVAACLVYSLVMMSRLPSVVPIHWNIQGKVDGYGSPWISLWLMPGVMILMLGLTVALPAISPKKFEIDRFASTYGLAMFLVALLMAALHFVILRTTVNSIRSGPGSASDIGSLMMVVLFLFFALIGNLFGRIKQNFFMGIRTPWTLADERVWDRTHREAGHIWLIGGLLGALASGFGMPVLPGVILILVISLAPVVRSYVIYRQLNPNGRPPAAA